MCRRRQYNNCGRPSIGYTAPQQYIAGPQMPVGSQVQYIPITNCAHRRKTVCCSCRRNYGYAPHNVMPAVPRGRGRRRQRRRGPIALLISAIIGALSGQQRAQGQQRGLEDEEKRILGNPISKEQGDQMVKLETEGQNDYDMHEQESPPRYSFVDPVGAR